MKLKPQVLALLAFLRERGALGVSPLDCWLQLGIYRASGRVLELRRAGYVVTTERVRSGCHVFARYRLVEVAT